MRKSLITTALLLTTLCAFAGPVSQETAMQTAQKFLNKRGGKKAAPLKSVTPKTRLLKSAAAGSNAPYYIFNVGDAEGFVIVSGEDTAIPVLGYAEEGTFDWENMPENLREWMKINEIYMENCRKGNGALQSPKQKGTVVKEPLLGDIKWGQDDPYNLKCPTYTEEGTTKHYYVGCVATAATQIMRYYNYPTKGNGSKTYTDKTGCGQTMSADFGNTTYDWANMLTSYREVTPTEQQKEAVSTLAAHFGVAVDMEYQKGGSGAVSPIVPHAFRHYFLYDSGTTMRKRNYYDTSEWIEIIKKEIDEERPVYYAASSEDGQGGHAFLCDGYDTEDFFHFNWGWYGNYNGYFSVNHLEPAGLGEGGGKGQYNIDQEIITGIQPPTNGGTAYERPLYFSTLMTYNGFGDEFSIGGTIENYDVTPFSGQIGAVLVRNGQIIAELKAENYTINAYENRRTGYTMGLVVRNATKEVGSNIEDGDAYIHVAFREKATDEWQLMRHAIGRNPRNIPYSYRIKARGENGYIEVDEVEMPKPDVTILEKLEPSIPEVYAKGSVVFPMSLRNDSKHLHLKNIVVRFQDVDDNTKIYDYENEVNIYDQSTEDIRLLINLADTMPAGNYNISVYEKGFPEHPFTELVESDVLTVLPESSHPVMHLTQNVLWQRRDGEIIANQGDMIYFAMNSRNYGTAGKIGVILYLVDMNNPEKRYMFKQENINVAQGEAKTVTFYGKMLVNPGEYFIQTSYITANGEIVDDNLSTYYNDKITVGTGSDIKLKGVAIALPDRVVVGEKLTGSITFQAPAAYNGSLYVRMRQFTQANGGILKMGNVNLAAGGQVKVEISQTITYEAGHYILMYDFGSSSSTTSACIGDYDKVYKIIDVIEPTGINNVIDDNSKPIIFVENGLVCVATKGNTKVKTIEVFDLNGRCLARNTNRNDIDASLLHNSVYMVRVVTGDGTYTQKIVK